MVDAVNSAATLIASRYEAARSSRVRAPSLIHYQVFKNGGASFNERVTRALKKAMSYHVRMLVADRGEPPRKLVC